VAGHGDIGWDHSRRSFGVWAVGLYCRRLRAEAAANLDNDLLVLLLVEVTFINDDLSQSLGASRPLKLLLD
jgi:hypothetical protein